MSAMWSTIKSKTGRSLTGVKKNFGLVAILTIPLILSLIITRLATGEIKFDDSNLSDFLKTIGAFFIAITILGPWAIWIYYPNKTAHKPKDKEIAKGISLGRVKKTGWIVMLVGGIGLAVWGGYTVFAGLKNTEKTSPIATTMEGVTGPRGPVATSSRTERVTTKTIIAKPDEFSDFVWIPPNHKFEWESTGCIEIKTGLGKIYGYCPGSPLNIGDNLSPLDGRLSFRSLTGDDEEVFVEWEPK